SAVPGDYTFSSSDNGGHTFTGDVTLVTAGSQAVTATDTITSSLTGSATINVSTTTLVEGVVINGADGAVLGATDASTVQRSKVNSIAFTFPPTVTLDAGALQVLKYVGSTPTTAEGLIISTGTVVVNGVAKTQVTIRFTGSDIIGGSLSDGNYQLLVDYT